MQPVGIGIDIIDISRVRAVIERHGDRFSRRIWTGAELAESTTRDDPLPYLAGRFAAKEAVLKALGTGLSGGIRWVDVEILRGDRGAPFVRLEGEAERQAARLGISRIFVSISHSEAQAAAQAVGVGGPGVDGADGALGDGGAG